MLQTATMVFDLCTGYNTIEYICDEMQSRFPDVSSDIIRSDVEEIIYYLRDLRLLRSLTKETANFLILDEPSSFMDFESSNELMSVLQSVRNDRIILLISHDPIYSESDFIKISI